MSLDQKKKILLVDDDPSFREVLQGGLESNGYIVITAASGRDGLASVQKDNPDIIIADLTMPDMDGWRLSQVLRQDEKYKAYEKVPIIILSGLVEKSGPAERGEMGDFYLGKPFELANLVAKIKELLKQ